MSLVIDRVDLRRGRVFVYFAASQLANRTAGKNIAFTISDLIQEGL